jgi:hypothetical protein
MRSLIAALLVATLLIVAAPSPAVELQTIARAASEYHNPNARLEDMYRAALLNTSEQATIAPDGTAYVKTGDIPAEWLRDASAQVRPYLFFAKSDGGRCAAARYHRARRQVSAGRPVRQRLHDRLRESGRKSSSWIHWPIRSSWLGAIGRRPATLRFLPVTSRLASTKRSRRWSASKITRTTHATRTRNCATTTAIPVRTPWPTPA